MKTITSTKYIDAILTIAIFALVFNSCKKADLTADNNTATAETNLDRAKANVQKRIAEMGGVPHVFPVHKKMPTIWVDKNKVPIDPKFAINSAGCTNFDIPDYTDLIQYQRIYNCALKEYYIQFEYNVSWNKVIVGTNANDISTEGYIWIQDDATGTLNYYYTADKNDTVIKDLGVDPNNSSNHIYNVRFDFGKKNHASSAIPTGQINGDINGTYTVRLGATFASNCPDDYALYILPANWFGFTGATGESTCTRTDYPIFQDPTIFGSQDRIGIGGYNPLYVCAEYGGSFVRNDLLQVEYSVNGGMNWTPFPNVLGGGSTTNPLLDDGYLRYLDFAESDTTVLVAGTYDIILRFRNWKYASVPSPLTIPNWPTNCRTVGLTTSGRDDYETWAYEYWLGVVIQ